jgi:hypothetical protein
VHSHVGRETPTRNAVHVVTAAAITGLKVHFGTPFTNSVTVAEPLRTTATWVHAARVNAAQNDSGPSDRDGNIAQNK